MQPLSDAELRTLAATVFGRELSEAQVSAYRGRLPTMLRAAEMIRAWEPRLGDTAPAAINAVVPAQAHADEPG